MTERPAPPPAPEKLRFPTLALVVPLVLSVAMAILFQTPLALMMGVLGPVMVVGGWFDQVRQARASHNKQLSEHTQALGVWEEDHELHQKSERERCARDFPAPDQWISDELWRGLSPGVTQVRVGVSWTGNSSVITNPGLVLVDVREGLALVGGPEALGVWQNLVLQWCVATPGFHLPRRLAQIGNQLPVDIHGVSRLTWVSHIRDVPPDVYAVLVLSDSVQGTLSVRGVAPHRLRADTATLATLVWGLRKLCPPPVEKTTVAVDATRRDQLWFHLRPKGPSWDLVSCGPHAVVWGATGSGKSVAVVSLISSLVNHYSPKDLALVVIDFKGGAGLAPLRAAPHTIGWVTDLDPGKSQRVMLGLRTEMVTRETILATAEVSDLSQLAKDVEMPRLLVVVDEVGWLLTNHPEWVDVLADVLARGRSLGIHVVLSTQRVSGVLTRTMMANIALRLCGVVRDEQELSEWMPGVRQELASGAPRMKPGEVVMSAGDAYPEQQEVGILTPTVGSESPGTWRVWVDDLPTFHPWTSTSFGLVECVETQTHREASYRPGDGSVLIVGDGRSGRTTASYAVGGLYESVWLASSHAAETWLALHTLSGTNTAVVIDDVDVLLQGAGGEGEAFLLDALESFRGTLILSVKPEHRVSRTIARFAPHTVLLSISKSEQAALWNARSTTIPGRGIWRGDCVQIGCDAPEPTRWSSPPTSKNLERTIVVTEDASTWVDYPVHSVLSMDQFVTARTHHTLGSDRPRVVWDQVSHREVRFATGGTSWIPPLEPPEDTFWMTSGGVPALMRPVDWLR